MSKEPLQHFPAEHISQCVNKAVESTGNPGKNTKFPGSECTHSFHRLSEVAVAEAAEALAPCRVKGPFSLPFPG